jgi:hypothetical protein
MMEEVKETPTMNRFKVLYQNRLGTPLVVVVDAPSKGLAKICAHCEAEIANVIHLEAA